jgi:hypothetical protein
MYGDRVRHGVRVMASRFGGALAFTIAALACRAPSRPAADATPHPSDLRKPGSVDANCGDIPDPSDACPLLDGCPGSGTDAGHEGDDGCPGPGGIPSATDCLADESRISEIARQIRKRPGLTSLRIASSVPGCSELLRRGIERSGVGNVALVAVTRGVQDPCARWAHFEVASWEGRACQ